jgi:hypothetical protein
MRWSIRHGHYVVWSVFFRGLLFSNAHHVKGYSTFLPTIIKGLGDWDTAQTQALTIPCYALGAITYLLVARLSDAHQERGLYVVICGTVSIVGYGILIADVSSGVHYFATCLVAIGLYVCVGLPLAWLPANSPRYGKRTTASGLQLTIGNAGGIGAPFYYATKDAPRYVKGQAITLGLVAGATLLYGFLSLYFTKRNVGRREGKEDYKTAGKSEAEIAELGDENPAFIFTK